MTHDEQLALCRCGDCEMETMVGLLSALAKAEVLHPSLPQKQLRGAARCARAARRTEILCERRSRVMSIIDATALALCGGAYQDFEESWPGDSVWMSFESWAFGGVREEELAALMAMPFAAGPVAEMLKAGNEPGHWWPTKAEIRAAYAAEANRSGV